MHIVESTLRLFFDLLHGIKRMDVPLVMVLEFIILLGYDGQLEQSDLEKELFTSAIDQLKERFNSLDGVQRHIFDFSFRGYFPGKFCFILESHTSGNKNDKARKCTCLALCENVG